MNNVKIVPEYDSKNIVIKNLFYSRLRASIELTRNELLRLRGGRIVDFGCGDGLFLALLEKEFPKVKTFGVDILPEVAETKKFLRADIKIADLKNTSYENNYFDIIFCLDTLEHFEKLSDPINEIKRVLKKDGILVISIPTENFIYKLGRFFLKGTFSSKDGPSSSPHYHNAITIRRFLQQNGFKVIRMRKITMIPGLRFFEVLVLKNLLA